ncbi:hypothetical protein CIHG_07102 [Coccidioides immitis H538.4]|uniref:Uncharacterized protein n=1 Tax=Coccidioides immitis H538.4 TaxID=396776 RepID=A0A0J8RYB6_COCIT|nr:hypothetical protein CIHG_07102 [Coccidioides immitis H538.4]
MAAMPEGSDLKGKPVPSHYFDDEAPNQECLGMDASINWWFSGILRNESSSSGRILQASRRGAHSASSPRPCVNRIRKIPRIGMIPVRRSGTSAGNLKMPIENRSGTVGNGQWKFDNAAKAVAANTGALALLSKVSIEPSSPRQVITCKYLIATTIRQHMNIVIPLWLGSRMGQTSLGG